MTEENTSENEDATFSDVEAADGAKRLGGRFIAWLALLMSIGALVLAGLDWSRDRNVASS